MDYKETINYLYNRLPMFSRIGEKAYKKDLHNTLVLLESLGNPHTKFKSIHIAGTNGKGSTSNMLAAILQTAGYKTGLYTSPHIKDFRERIRVNGEMAEEAFVVSFTKKIKPCIDAINPSFFELTVAMAFEYFAQKNIEIAVIETGLGGRLDSTNVITPELSIITNIGYDHVQILGESLEKIAIEKAGIIKKAVPVVVGEYLPETKNIFLEKAEAENAKIYFAQDKYAADIIGKQGRCLTINVTERHSGPTKTFNLSLAGNYQAKNLLTVLVSTSVLIENGYKITKAAIKYALQNTTAITGLRGRWEIAQTHPTIIYDVAHNEDGINQIMSQLNSEFPSSTKHFVIGFVKDKEVEKVLKLFPSDAAFYFTNAHLPRALPANELAAMAACVGKTGLVFDDVNDALAAAKASASAQDVIVVCGSFFIIAEIRD